MKKTIFSVLMLVMGFVSMVAQQFTPLPIMPGCKSGVLPNGLTYYVMHNEEPQGRANFYIAQKVGSTLEKPEQLGLAHFLEHMAFNGTTHYPGKAMLDYLQSKGIRFGEDINAYTDFDETVYNIDNVPTSDTALMDSVLLAICDWSNGILLETDEINAERGVIQEEWRGRRDAGNRHYEVLLKNAYQEYQYQRMPIGLMDVVMNFEPDVLRSYYKEWYRPDQQGIIIVGDFNVDEMEQKVINLFSQNVMPENPTPRTYPEISDNEEPIFVTFEDPEFKQAVGRLIFKMDRTPFEYRNTVEAYINDSLVEAMIQTVLNDRLTEYSQNPDCPYAYAGVFFDNFIVAHQKEALYVTVVPKGNNTAECMGAAMKIIAQALKGGFNSTEFDRARTNVLSNYERIYNNRKKLTNSQIGTELCRLFIDNVPAPGIEVEYELAQQVLNSIPLEYFNQMIAGILTPNNQVFDIFQPKQEGYTLPTREEVVPMVEQIIAADYEPVVEEAITEPFISKMRKPGKIKSEKFNEEWGTTDFTLSNGVKVIVLPTDYSDDQIVLKAFRKGGKQEYKADQAANVLLMDNVVETAKLGNFDQNTLRKYLAGNHAYLTYTVGSTTHTLNGSSTVKDLPTLMELVYAYFCELHPDKVTYDISIEQARPMLANQESNPESAFMRKRDQVRYGNNPLMNPMDVATLDAAQYDVMFDMAKKSMANAADYTFVIVGKVDIATLKPLLEKYIASLPSKGKPGKSVVKTPINIVEGVEMVEFQKPMETPSVMAWGGYSGSNLPYTVENDIMVSLMGSIIQQVYTATLREEEGGSYSPGAAAFMSPLLGKWELVSLIQTNSEQKDKILDRADKEIRNVLQNGAKPEMFNNVREALLNQYDINLRKNGSWVDYLQMKELGFDEYHGYRQALENLTLEKFNDFLRNVYDDKNRYQVVMEGVAVE